MKLALSIKRSLAYLVDCIVIFFFFFITQLTVFNYIRQRIGIDENWFKNGYYTELYVLITVSLPALLYFSILDSKLSKGTLGKRVLGICLLNHQHKQLSFAPNILRTFLKLLPWEIAHISNNIPIPLMFQESPGMRYGFVLCGGLLLVYVISTFATGGRQAIYDKIFQSSLQTQKCISA